jgi:ATP/ADP translocase
MIVHLYLQRKSATLIDTAKVGFEETVLTTPIVLFLLFGALFGLVTFPNRHLFSEGPTTRDESGSAGALRARLGWTLLCTMLWPIMVLTGLHSIWLLARRRAAAARPARD